MQSKIIANVVNLPDVSWNDKTLRKRQITFEDFETGVLTLWPEDEEVKQGDSLEHEIETTNFGKEIKRPKKSGGGFKGGGGFKPNPRKEALITASGIVKSIIESNSNITDEGIETALRHFHAVGLELLKEDE